MNRDDTRDALEESQELRAEDPASSITGRTLGDFVVRDKLGAGAFGAVYRAEQALLQREAVVKVLHARHRRRDNQVQRFLREAQLASRLDHPYAAHIYAFGAEQDGLLWIAMELVRGITLDQYIRDRGRVPLARFVPLFEHLCEVVQTAHELGIVHRDLKPANIMVLTRAGRLLPKLLDLGIAKGVADLDSRTPSQPRLDAMVKQIENPTGDADPSATADTMRPTLTQEGALIGSPPYMAPEQWVGGQVGAAADLYALAAVAYEALTGKVLFNASTVSAIAKQHAKGIVPPLGDAGPPALHAVLKKALSRDPAQRYPDATSFARALREAAGVGETTDNLPRMPDAVRDSLLADAPQPIAESVAAIEGARGAHPLLDAAWQTFAVATRYLGLLAIAAASRTELADAALPDAAAQLLAILRKRGLSDEEWLDLARELCRPFSTQREAHPVPEMVELLFSADGQARALPRAEALLQLQTAPRGEQLERLSAIVEELSGLLAGLGFLSDYHLAVRRGDKLERWMGVRRQHRRCVPLPAGEVKELEPMLMSPDGAPVLLLWPLVQIASPAPGAPEEVFLVEGQGRHGPRLVAPPNGFEHRDPTLWDHVRIRLTAAETVASSGERERAPYRGLDGFTSDDAGLFFGRERESEAVANRLRIQALIAIVGPSGAGKSSFVQAGLLPLLPVGWRAITIRPGHDPMETLLARLGREGMSPQVLEAALRSDRAALYYELERIAGDGTVVLVVDQFEEVFTLCDDAAVRAAFCEAIVRAAPSLEARVRVVLTMRDDFLLRAESEPSLRERLAQGLQLLTTPSASELQRILVEPARAVGYDFADRALAAEMVEAVVGQPGALPLLSFTAAKLWDKRDRHFKQLRRSAYEALGKVGGALARHAEEVLESMSIDERRLVRELFRHLVTAEGTRAVMSRQELGQILGGGHGDTVVERLIAARLLSAREGENRVEQIEIVHEALLSAWPRLGQWRREDAEGARIRDQLRAAARQWDQRGRPRGMLWRAEALAELELWRRRHGGGLTAVDEAFAEASVADAARGRRLVRGAVVVVIALLFAGIVTLVRANGRAKASAAVAEDRLAELYEETGRKAFLDGQPQQALVYLSEAQSRHRQGPAVRFLVARAFEALAPLQRTYSEGGELATDAALDVKADLVVTLAEDDAIRVWRALDGTLQRKLPSVDGPLCAVRLFGDGKRILSASRGGTLRVLRVDDGGTIQSLATGGQRTTRATISARDEVAVEDEHGVHLWRLADGSSRTIASEAGVHAPVFSHDGRHLLLKQSDGQTALWDLGKGTAVRRYPGVSEEPVPGAFDANDVHAVFPAGGGDISLVDVEHGTPIRSIEAHPNGVNSVAFDPDGKRLVTVGWDRSIRVWDVTHGKQVTSLAGNAGPIFRASFTPDGESVVSLSEDGTGRLWDLRTGTTTVVLHDHAGWLLDLGLEGAWLLTHSAGSGARLWDLRRSPLLGTRVHSEPVMEARFLSADRVVTRDAKGTLRTWRGADVEQTVVTNALRGAAVMSADGRIAAAREHEIETWRLGESTRMHLPIEQPSWLMFGAAGRRLFAISGSGEATLFDLEGGAPVHLEGAPLESAGVSRDGQLFIGGDTGRLVRLWRSDGTPAGKIDGQRGGSNSVELSADNRRAITCSGDEVIRVADVASSKLVAALEPHTTIPNAALSSDGALAALGTNDGAVQVWDVASARLLLDRVGHGGTVQTVSFSPDDRQLLSSGGNDRTARLWSMETSTLTAAELARRVRCDLKLQLTGERVTRVAQEVVQKCSQGEQGQ